MSLILEALRKSEAQRRLGQVPDLLTGMADPGRVRRPALSAWPWFVLGVLVVALTAWWLGRQYGSEPLIVAAGTRADRPGLAPGRGGIAADPNPALAGPRSVAEGRSVRSAAPAATAPQPMLDGHDTPGDRSAQPVARADVPTDPVASPAAEPVRVQPVVPVVAPPVGQADTPPERAGSASVPGEDADPADAAGPASEAELRELRARLEALAARERAARGEAGPAATAAAVQPTVDPEPVPWTSLASGQRADAPDLKLSLHVFGASPDRRFVVLDGRRLVEGDAITPRIRLVEIRSDGAVVEVDGRRALVARP